MKTWTTTRERYQRDSLPVRLGGIAANLARVKSFVRQASCQGAVCGIIDQSKWFIEWAAPDTEIDTAVALAELQLQLSRWQRHWPEIWEDPVQRRAVAEEAGAWSNRVLEMSGLLDQK
ncbi:MAG: hypothetical protein HYV26_13410 [Candidatus Hydrogenedentes bacterium]|nr:hypothetical protein [Candidatus Hydrogenedentota bacterium]